jgi:sulfur carrier protein
VQQKAGERRRNETVGQEACEREVIVNGETCSTAASTLADLIEELGYGERRIATAVNGQFVAGNVRAATAIAAGDSIEIVAPRQGG